MESITDMGLDVVEASGSWRAIGAAEGQAQRPAVKYTVYCYANYHAGSAEIGLLDRVTEQVQDFLTDRFPQEWDELCGIAEGAEIELPLLVAANCLLPYPKPPRGSLMYEPGDMGNGTRAYEAGDLPGYFPRFCR